MCPTRALCQSCRQSLPTPVAFSFHKIKHFKLVFYLPILAKLQFSFFEAEDIFNAAAGVERCWEGFACPPCGALVSCAMEMKPTDPRMMPVPWLLATKQQSQQMRQAAPLLGGQELE